MNSSFFQRLLAAVRQQWPIVACVLLLGVLGAAFAIVSVHPKYAAVTTVLMVAEPPEASNPNVPLTATKPLLSMDLPTLATSPTILRRFRDDLGETASLDKLRSRIRAKVSVDSSIMPVQYTDKSPQAAIRGANVLSDEIVRFYRETATTRFDSLISDFDSQLAKRRKQLTELDGELATAAKAYPYIDVSAPGMPANGTQSVYQRLIALQAESDELRGTVAADAVAAQSASALITNATPLAQRDVVENDAAYRKVRDQYAKDFAELDKLNSYGTERYPGLAELRETVQREAAMVGIARSKALGAGPASNMTYVAALDAKAKADATYAADQAKLETQNDELTRLHAQIGQGSIATDVARIRRDRDSADAAYVTIAARLAKAIADRAEAASTGSVIVLDRAQFAPKVAFAGGEAIAVSIMFLSVWLALTLAMLIDSSQQRFRDTLTVETVYATNVIGSIA